MMIEQPLDYDDIADHAALQRRLKTPICLDESIKTVGAAREAIAAGACRIINIKPGRVGGFAESIRLHDLCAAARHPGVARRHARVGHRPRREHSSLDAPELLAARRRRGEQAVLRSRPDRAADRRGRRRHDCRAGPAPASASPSARTASSARTRRRTVLVCRRAPLVCGRNARPPHRPDDRVDSLCMLLIALARPRAPARRQPRAGAAVRSDLRAEDGVDSAARGSARPAGSGAASRTRAAAAAAAMPGAERRRAVAAAAAARSHSAARRRRSAHPPPRGAGDRPRRTRGGRAAARRAADRRSRP